MKAPFATLCVAMPLFLCRARPFEGDATTTNSQVLQSLDAAKNDIDSKLFLYKTPASQWEPSVVYRYDDFKESLHVMASDGVAGKKFYMGESDVENGHVYGLVNIAAFLAQSMKETIQYDACDENSWDLIGGKYPLSNACGQLGQSYQDYHCSPEEAHMECPVDPNMSITGVTHAKWYGAPGPLFCGPKTEEQPFSGVWDHLYQCNRGWANPPEFCEIYEDQKAGRYDQSTPSANTAGRTDVEGCCWWGRGVIQTSGICNFGKLNYYLGAGAVEDGRPAKYPQIDFCKDPEVICASSEYKELKWIAGEFYWMESVETYNEGGWDYIAELRKFVDEGMTGTGFIDGVSGIVNRGCHNPPCGTGVVDGGWERAENFKKVLNVFFGGSYPQVGTSSNGSTPQSAPPPSGSASNAESFSMSLSPEHLTDSDISIESSTSELWYPDYNTQWSLGKCVNETPIPSGRATYDSGVECCQKAYGTQSSGTCVDSLSRAPSVQVASSTGSPGAGISPQSFQNTRQPVQSPSGAPSAGPSPQAFPTTRQPVSSMSDAGKVINSETFIELENALEDVKNDIDSKIFLYKTPGSQWVQSTIYRYDDFKESIFIMASDGVAGKKFYIGESDVENGHVYGLVNIAAFLAQSMKETIQYDACDENSWDLVGGKYPLSNACGQLGQSYQDYHCSPEEAHMECPVDPNMSITGVTHAKWYGAPGPLFCGPKTEEQPFSGVWDHIYQCDKGWANPPEFCEIYEDQKAGRYDQSTSYANAGGRTDVEGCCWWGRGVIQTSGVCNFGKMNYYLGAGAKRDGRTSKYPSIDFCKDPEVICSSSEYKELKWIAGEFYWMESVESYSKEGWDYIDELRKFVDGGMTGTGFINGVSGIVNRGCHNPPCGTGAVDGGSERAENFEKLLDLFFDGTPPPMASSLPAPLSEALHSSPTGLTTQVASPPTGSPYGPSTDGTLPTGLPLAPLDSGKWYPSYNAQFSLGKCLNETPIPSGKRTYDTGLECCEHAYANQSSGTCISSLPQIHSDPSGSPPGTPVSLASPQTLQTSRQPVTASSEAGKVINSETFIELENALEDLKDDIDSKIFLYKTPGSQWVQSTIYRYDDFKESIFIMASDGVAGKKFYIGESDVENGHVYGLVNIAAFLAQSMKETIQYDACDENSWDLVGGKYPLSNACGQLGQSYQDYRCSPEEAHMECPVDPDMSITGVTHAKWYGAPGPLFCGPKTEEQPFSGVWDHIYQCDKGWANPPEFCEIYEDQKAGRYDQSTPSANTAGRTDVEGCCWWGRGVIQTSGVCNFGKLNYYLGARANEDGRPAKYPTVNFCEDPEVICSSSDYKELKWIAGEFYWMESVETYDEDGWNYIAELRKFVDGGMIETGFIDGVSGIVNRGCHNPPCGTGAVDGGWERAENFKKVLDLFFEKSPPQIGSSTSDSPPLVESLLSGSRPQSASPIASPLGSLSDSDASAESSNPGRWYPDYNAQWSLGKCMNEAPIPGGRPTYDTAVECCQRAYANQASGACASSLPQPYFALGGTAIDFVPGSSMANAFAASIYTHARQQSNFIAYECGSSTDMPMNSLVVDILFDYEISVSRTSQAAHVLPSLKKQIMDELAHTLGCQAIIRRNLKTISQGEVLLGLHSAEGSDVIDGKKGFCTGSTERHRKDGKCVPVVGHIAAIFQRNASVDAMLLTKDIILHSIQTGMSRNGYSNQTQRISFISEHGNGPQYPENERAFADDSDENDNTTSYIGIGFALMNVTLGVTGILLLNRKSQKVAVFEGSGKNKEDIVASHAGGMGRTSSADNCSESGSDSNGDSSLDNWSADLSSHSEEGMESRSAYFNNSEDVSVQAFNDSDYTGSAGGGNCGGVNFVIVKNSDDEIC